MVYKVIASGSDGNAVLYHNTILVDCGVPFSSIMPYLYDLQLVLLTHEHLDHFSVKTVLNLVQNRPTLRIGCCAWLANRLKGIKNLDVYSIGTEYDYGVFSIMPIKLYHDVPNCGYRIIKDNYRILHATDTAHLNGISAKNYDLYAIEHNYNEETIYSIISRKIELEEFCYEEMAIKTHLSEQQSRQFIFENKGNNYEVLRLHETKLTK